jgi:hypothetical protein
MINGDGGGNGDDDSGSDSGDGDNGGSGDVMGVVATSTFESTSCISRH